MSNRHVVFRKGSLDAFIAAFVYWKLFKSSLGQTYRSVDPFGDQFNDELKTTLAPDFVISIGANISQIHTQNSSRGLYSFENSQTFVPPGSDQYWKYYYDTNLSLTQLVLKTLEAEDMVSTKHPDFVLMNQYLKFSSVPGEVIDQRVAEELAILIPAMSPNDFEVLDALLHNPMTGMLSMRRMTPAGIARSNQLNLLERARGTAITFDELVLVNSGLYEHPVCTTLFQSPTRYVLIYEVTERGVRGKLIAPKSGGNAIEYMANATMHYATSEASEIAVSGTAMVADVLIPHSRFFSMFA